TSSRYTAALCPDTHHSLDQRSQLYRSCGQRNWHSSVSSALLLGRNGRRGRSFAFRFATSVYAWWTVRLGALHPFSGCLGLRFYGTAIRCFRSFYAALPQESVAKEIRSRLTTGSARGC